MKTTTLRLKDSYFALVRSFPLVPIRNEKQYDAAVAFLEPLVIRASSSLDAGERAYMEALTLFVEEYERSQRINSTRGLKPVDLLRFLMAENKMKPIDLGKVLGSRSVASQILRGQRGLSKQHIIALSQRFKVEPGLFIDAA
jgi:HTH-type transcriptional regulator/antitoxin HigA